MKHRLLILLFLANCQLPTIAQEVRKPPANYGGLSLVFDATNMSGTAGIEYERYLYSKNNFAAGIRGNYIKKYESGNADISFSGWASGYHDQYDITLAQVWANAYGYTSRHKKYAGFFLNAGIGMTYSVARKKEESNYGDNVYKNYLPGIIFGAGTQFPIGEKTDFRSMLTTSFSGKQQSPRPGAQGTLALLSLTISIGF